MTDTDTGDLEARLTALEARLALLGGPGLEPLAAAPPVTIGELVDVPAPGSPIASQWAQEVTNRAVHRFANNAARDAWAAANGSLAYTADRGRLWMRVAGAWWLIEGQTPRVACRAATNNNLATGLFLNVPWDGVNDADTDGMHPASGTRITATIPGLYLFSYGVTFSALNAAGTRAAWIQKNGAGVLAHNDSPAGGTQAVIYTGSIVLAMAVNDYAEVRVFQSSGATLTVVDPSENYFQAAYLGMS
jgi:hypothetical protein